MNKVLSAVLIVLLVGLAKSQCVHHHHEEHVTETVEHHHHHEPVETTYETVEHHHHHHHHVTHHHHEVTHHHTTHHHIKPAVVHHQIKPAVVHHYVKPVVRADPVPVQVSKIPVFRYWNGRDHFYTTHAGEIGTTTPGHVGHHNHKSEGVG